MKTKYILTLLIATASVAHANLIDFTPGGWTGQLPPSVVQWLDNVENHLYGFDVAVLNSSTYGTGWVGNGFVPGGTFFNTNLFTFTNEPASCQITWNFPNYPNPTNWELSWVWVQGNNWNNIYQIPLDQLLAGDGTITLNGVTGINEIAFLGQHIRDVPDTGGTLLLLGFGLAALVGARMALPEMVGKHLSVSRSLRESLPNRRRLGASVERPD